MARFAWTRPPPRRAFESLDCRMSQDERVRFAWKIALNNIAEEISRCALRHGVDSRDFSLMAFGSAGPMLLAGVLELVKARRLIVPPHPGTVLGHRLAVHGLCLRQQPQPVPDADAGQRPADRGDLRGS